MLQRIRITALASAALAALLGMASSTLTADAANCGVASQITAKPSYTSCNAAVGGVLNFAVSKGISLDQANFCSADACLAMYNDLKALGGLMCLQNYNTASAYKLWKEDKCFVDYGLITTPAPAPTAAVTPTPTTKKPTVTTDAGENGGASTTGSSNTGSTTTTTTTPKTTKTPTTNSGSTKASSTGSSNGDTTNDGSSTDSNNNNSDNKTDGADGQAGGGGNGQAGEGGGGEGGGSQTTASGSATTGTNGTSGVSPLGPNNASRDGDYDGRNTSASPSVWIATGGGTATLFLAIFVFVFIHRRRRSVTVAKNLDTTPGGLAASAAAGGGEYLATLQSSRSSQLALTNDAFAVLGASGLDASFIVPTSKFAFWDDEAVNAVRIPYEKLVFGKLVSRGGYGEVHKGKYRHQTVAIKTLLPERRKDMRQIENFLAEVKLMAALEHDHIVQFVGVAWDSLNELCVVSEFMPRGDLRSLLWEYEANEKTHQKGFNLEKIKIALHVAHALTYMHSLKPMVLHRDLKSRNILLDSHLDAKVTDFGVSRERADSTMTVGVGSSLWMAPEVMMGGRYDEKADVFSFGVVLSELDVHALPYSHAIEPGTGRKLPDTVIVQMMTTHRITVAFTGGEASPMAVLGRQCVALDPADRPSAAEVQHLIHQVWRNAGGVTR